MIYPIRSGSEVEYWQKKKSNIMQYKGQYKGFSFNFTARQVNIILIALMPSSK